MEPLINDSDTKQLLGNLLNVLLDPNVETAQQAAQMIDATQRVRRSHADVLKPRPPARLDAVQQLQAKMAEVVDKLDARKARKIDPHVLAVMQVANTTKVDSELDYYVAEGECGG